MNTRGYKRGHLECIREHKQNNKGNIEANTEKEHNKEHSVNIKEEDKSSTT